MRSKKVKRFVLTAETCTISDFFADPCQILMAKNLRAHPFTDTVFREMAINFPKGT